MSLKVPLEVENALALPVLEARAMEYASIGQTVPSGSKDQVAYQGEQDTQGSSRFGHERLLQQASDRSGPDVYEPVESADRKVLTVRALAERTDVYRHHCRQLSQLRLGGWRIRPQQCQAG